MFSIPVLVVGRSSTITSEIAKLLSPEIDAVHVCYTVEVANTEIPALLRGEVVKPASDLGSNTTRSPEERRVPVVVIVGGAFTDEDIGTMRAREGVKQVPWLKSDLRDLPSGLSPFDPGFPKWSAEQVKKAFKEHGLGLKNDTFEEGTLLYF